MPCWMERTSLDLHPRYYYSDGMESWICAPQRFSSSWISSFLLETVDAPALFPGEVPTLVRILGFFALVLISSACLFSSSRYHVTCSDVSQAVIVQVGVTQDCSRRLGNYNSISFISYQKDHLGRSKKVATHPCRDLNQPEHFRRRRVVSFLAKSCTHTKYPSNPHSASLERVISIDPSVLRRRWSHQVHCAHPLATFISCCISLMMDHAQSLLHAHPLFQGTRRRLDLVDVRW